MCSAHFRIPPIWLGTATAMIRERDLDFTCRPRSLVKILVHRQSNLFNYFEPHRFQTRDLFFEAKRRYDMIGLFQLETSV